MTPEKPSGSGPGAKPAEDTVPDDKGAQRLAGRFARHYYEYKNALCRAQLDAAKRQEEANARFAEASQRDQKGAFKPAQDAYFEYLRVFQRSQMNPMDTGVADVYHAQNNYLEIYQRSQEAARKLADERRREYADECEAIQKEIGSLQRAAFTDYVRAIKGIWSELDPAACDARALGAAAQSIASVATCMLAGGASCPP